MNSKRVLGLVLAALVVAPLILAMVPAQAQIPPALVLYTAVASPGTELFFMLDRTLIPIPGHPVADAHELFFYLSGNVYAEITIGDRLLGSAVVYNYTVIFGSIKIPADVPEGIYWLKVAAAPQAGAPAIVSESPIYIAEDPSMYATLAREDLSRIPVSEPIKTTNIFDLTLNLTAVYVLVPGYDLTGKSLAVQLLVGGNVRRSAEGTIPANGTASATSDFLSGAVISRPAIYVVTLTGEIADFGQLLGDLKVCATPLGVNVVCARYGVSVSVNITETFTGYYVNVTSISSMGKPVVNETISVPEVILVLHQEARVYPVSNVRSLHPGVVGPATDMNAGDVVELEVFNFVCGARTLIVEFFSVKGDKLVSLARVSVNTTVANGYSRFNVTLPPILYGGEMIIPLVMDSVWPGYALFDITQSFKVGPYFIARAFDNEGKPVIEPPTFVPGEYIYIRGYGFIMEELTFTLIVDTTSIPLNIVAGPLWDAKTGDFAVIVQIPGDAILAPGASVTLRVAGTGGNFYQISGTVTYGTVRVYVNPKVGLAGIDQPVFKLPPLLTRYPYGATWLPEAMRTIETIEVIGFTPGTSVTISLDGYIMIPAKPLPTGYLKLENVRMPVEIPRGNYYVAVGGVNAATKVLVDSTLAVFGPQDRLLGHMYAPDKMSETIHLPLALDLTMIGFGFSPNSIINIKVVRVGLTVPIFDGSVETNVQGSFSYTLPLSVVATLPGQYRVFVTDQTSGLTFVINVYVAALPVFTIKVAIGPAQFADLPVNVWVLALLDSEPLEPGRVVAHNIEGIVVYYDTKGYPILHTLTFTYTGIPGLFHAVFVPGSELKGTNAAVIVRAEVRVHELAPVQTAIDIASFVVPPYSLAEIKAIVEDTLAKLDTVAKKLDEISMEIAEARAALSGKLDEVLAKIDQSKGDILAAIEVIAINLGDLSVALAQVNASLAAEIAKVAGRVEYYGELLAKGQMDIKTAIDAVSADLKSLAQALADFDKRTSDRLLAIASRLDEISKQIADATSAIRSDISAVRSDVAAVSSKIDALSAQLTSVANTLRSDIAAVSSKIDSLTAIASGIQSDVTAIRSDVGAIRTTVTAIDTRTGEIRTIVATINTKVDDISRVVTAINTAVAGLATKTDVATARDAVTGAVDKARSEIMSKLADIETVAETAAGVRTLAIINIILTLIVLGLAAYIAFARKG